MKTELILKNYEIAEKLCQFVYDLKMDFKKQEDTEC